MYRKTWSIVFIVILIMLVCSAYTQADYWVALPPYNILWPLWSPAMSPIDPVTGVPVPLVSSVTKNTLLPFQPAMVWDPASPEVNNAPYPWMLYNTPAALGGGLLFWDQFYGMRPWPPDYMLDPVTSAPVPIALPLSYWLLKPIAYSEIQAYNFLLGNAVYSNTYGVPFSSLLTASEFWGFPALSLPVI